MDIQVIKPMLAKPFDMKWASKFDSIFLQKKLDGCLEYNTIVELKNHGKIKIGELVENFESHKNDLIKSYNFQKGKIVYNKITNVFVNTEDVQDQNIEWFQIETETGETLIATGNHRIWIPSLKCWRQIKDLDGSEDLLLNT